MRSRMDAKDRPQESEEMTKYRRVATLGGERWYPCSVDLILIADNGAYGISEPGIAGWSEILSTEYDKLRDELIMEDA